MRPRSKRLSKRRLLLPTIREGSEEVVRDLNEANSGDSSTYVSSQQLEAVHQRLRLSRITEAASNTFQSNPNKEAHDILQKEQEGKNDELMSGRSDPLEYLYGHQSNHLGSMRRAFNEERFERHHGSVEEGRARTRAHSIPHASSPDVPQQRFSQHNPPSPSQETLSSVDSTLAFFSHLPHPTHKK
uniref:Uncharacterized protein n=1 Tax=Labrus bergylta TaxID=56723 RepID=A0A3Q3ENU5_9LABR